MKPLTVLNSYFNVGPDGTKGKGLKEFKAEVDELSPAEKLELATLAAEDMGVPLETES